jgi:hypothetical protein
MKENKRILDKYVSLWYSIGEAYETFTSLRNVFFRYEYTFSTFLRLPSDSTSTFESPPKAGQLQTSVLAARGIKLISVGSAP